MRSNTYVRVFAFAVVAVLAAGGCGGGDDGTDEAKETGTGSPSATASSAAPDGGGSDDGASAGAGSVQDTEGIWSATSDGKRVVLVVGGRKAALTTADGHLCSGTVSGDGKPALNLRCADGDTARTTGSVESNDGTTMRVAWKAGAEDTFKKSKDGQLPTALPSGLPTN